MQFELMGQLVRLVWQGSAPLQELAAQGFLHDLGSIMPAGDHAATSRL